MDGRHARAAGNDDRPNNLTRRKEPVEIKPGPEVGGASGWVDMSHGLVAMQRRDGTYLVIVEENYRAKNLVYQWRPAGGGPRGGAACGRFACRSCIRCFAQF
jgi:hypothetical protein